MPNFSQIGKVTWPRFFLKFESYRLLLFINCSVGAVISLCIGQFLFLGKNNIFWLSGGPYDKRAKNNFPLNRHFLKLRFPSKNVPLTSCWTNLTERKHTTRLHSFTFVTEHFLAGTDSAERLVLKWLNIVSAKVVVVLLHLVGSVGPILLWLKALLNVKCVSIGLTGWVIAVRFQHSSKFAIVESFTFTN